ncbi:MAG: F0F1 ATP synthase subunit epsilon [Verrucomicrobia bacterium]|nr:F0F1 ATP synthase subunit epsilon [Verrucomicrobiota bacterium]NBU07594.1 F0F1 ATP synthase subunit epsilon [Pseudomonadota bacterium]NDA65621.1 F0F1 ATP synthase subunit epsilon [Verrucomicrobiota bacterium]NDB74313.1 F0F1 ATP synthase subunit epsilon [Verrucomicrobiota bacterium]NDD36848.1 F0F1 ATP synthase subunit epsilon [Verrucomicrobiota bacterium]
MAATLKLEIVTPEAKIYSEDVDMVTLPGVEGEMGIYPMHIPLMTQIAHGEIVAKKGGVDHYLATGEGFVEITGDRVAILTDMAIKADDIDEAKAEEARKKAEARLAEKLTDEETATVQAALLHSLTQLNVKRRTRR